MADINELTAKLKAAALKAKAATEDYAAGRISITTCYSECAEFNSLTDGPDQILPLIEALEAAQSRIAELDAINNEQTPIAMRWRWKDPGGLSLANWWYHGVEYFEELSKCNDRECELLYATANIKVQNTEK